MEPGPWPARDGVGRELPGSGEAETRLPGRGLPRRNGRSHSARVLRPESPEYGAPPVTRDADRITAALKLANIGVLDYLVITHYHGDHVGNAAELASRTPIRHFIDHGPYTVEQQPNRVGGFVSYQPVREKAHATTAKPGDRIPISGLDVQVVSSAGQLISKPVAGAPGAGTPNSG